MESPPYVLPQRVADPECQLVNTIPPQPGAAAPVGLTTMKLEPSYDCVEGCYGGKPGFRLEPFFVPAVYECLVATQKFATRNSNGDMCNPGPRDLFDTLRSIVHEQVHVKKYGAVQDVFYPRFGTIHNSRAACNAAGEQLRIDANAAYVAQERRQSAHLDFIGQQRFGQACFGNGQTTREFPCTMALCGFVTY